MEHPDGLIRISNLYQLVVLDLRKVNPTKTEYDGRYWAFFLKNEAEPVLNDYETGRLKVIARDFVSSINRVKDRIFERERIEQKNGAEYGNHPSFH